MAVSLRMCSRLASRVFGLNSHLSSTSSTTGHHWQCMSTAPESNAETADNTKSEAPSSAEDVVAKAEAAFKEEKDKLMKDLQEVQDKYKRSLAETENVRQRMKKQIDDAKLFGIQGFCKDLLDVADILAKATESVPAEELSNPHLKTLFDGLKMTEGQLQKVFTRHGLVHIEPTNGDKFDPNVHEALFQVAAPEGQEVGNVALVQKVGYKLHSRTLRPAVVGVFK